VNYVVNETSLARFWNFVLRPQIQQQNICILDPENMLHHSADKISPRRNDNSRTKKTKIPRVQNQLQNAKCFCAKLRIFTSCWCKETFIPLDLNCIFGITIQHVIKTAQWKPTWIPTYGYIRIVCHFSLAILTLNDSLFRGHLITWHFVTT
jgi:hypothetical protein